MNAFSAQTPEDTATITLSGTGVAQRRFEFDGSGTLTLRTIIKSRYWYHTFSNRFWYIQYSWWCCRINSRTICCKSNSYRYHRCCRNKILPSIPRLRSIWYIHIIWRTHTSRYRLHTSIHWYGIVTTISGSADEVDLVREIGVGIATFSGACNSQIHSRRSGRNSPLRYKRRFCSHRTQSSLRILRRRQRSRHIWYYYNLWCWYYKTNTSLWLLRRRQRSRHIGNIYILQYSSRTPICRLHTFDWYWCCSPLPDKWNKHSNPSPSQLRDSRKIQRTWI